LAVLTQVNNVQALQSTYAQQEAPEVFMAVLRKKYQTNPELPESKYINLKN
jgi:hypothetical protein